jgi:hypothetical protein
MKDFKDRIKTLNLRSNTVIENFMKNLVKLHLISVNPVKNPPVKNTGKNAEE